MWSGMPAPEARPMFAPMLNPSGFKVWRSTVIVFLVALTRSAVCASSRFSSSPWCAIGATMTWPALYGNLFSSTMAPSGRQTTSSASGSFGFSMTRQKRQPGFCSPVMYSMRHGAHSRSIDLRLLSDDGDGGLGLDLRPRQGRDHTLPDPALSPAAVHLRLP